MLKLLFKISLRNVIRRKLQTSLLFFMILLTNLAIFAMVGMQTGAYKLIEDSYTQIFYGDIQIKHKDYESKEDDFTTFLQQEDITNLTNKLKTLEGNELFYSPRYIHFALADSNEKNYAFQLVGINPGKEANVSIVASKIIEGSYLTKDDYTGILIGKDLASFFNLKAGDEITLMTSDIYESFVIEVFTIKGIYQTGDAFLDKTNAFINFEYFQDNITYSNNTLTNITIKLKDSNKRAEIIEKLSDIKANNTKVISWSEILPDIKQTINFQFTVSMFFYVILVAIVGFAILNALVLSTMKRIPEFGILYAIGLNKKYFKYILIIENTIITTCAVVLASCLGMAFVLYFANNGIPLPSAGKSPDRPITLISNMIYPNPNNPLLLVGPLLMYVFATLSSIPAVLKLAKSNPIETITG